MRELLLWAGLILTSAHLLAEGMRRVRLSPVLGAIISGIFLGILADVAPGELAIGRDHIVIRFLAEIGIILLLFVSGLELNIEQFKEALRPGTIVASLGVSGPFAFNFLLGTLLGLQGRPLLTFASVFTATSVGITTAILVETGSVGEDFGRTILTAAVVDDVIGVILMSIVLSTGGGAALAAGLLLFLLVSLLVIKYFRLMVRHVFDRFISPFSKMGLILGIVLIFAFLTEVFGLAGITGAFVMGVAASQARVADEIREAANTINRDFFLPFFLFSAGALVNPAMLRSFNPLILMAIPLTVAGKVLGCGLGARVNGLTTQRSFIVGIGMIPMMEVVLILSTLAVSRGVFEPSFGAQLMTTVITYILIGIVTIPILLPRMIAGARFH